ncbi:hypothetical protein LJQ78_002469 [Acinetobacter baumannii]|nr:hypothetical protein [Acinetobacter baumannii]
MRRNELYHLQEQMLQPFSAHMRNRILALDYAQIRILTFEVPLVAEAFMDRYLETKGGDPFNFGKTRNEERIFYEISGAPNSNYDHIQHDMWDRNVPHTVYIENWDEEWKRRDFRWLDGKYCIHDTSSYFEFIDVQEVAKTFEDFKFNELKALTDERLAKTMTFDFTDEDIARIKPLALKAICMV